MFLNLVVDVLKWPKSNPKIKRLATFGTKLMVYCAPSWAGDHALLKIVYVCFFSGLCFARYTFMEEEECGCHVWRLNLQVVCLVFVLHEPFWECCSDWWTGLLMDYVLWLFNEWHFFIKRQSFVSQDKGRAKFSMTTVCFKIVDWMCVSGNALKRRMLDVHSIGLHKPAALEMQNST